MTLEEHQSAGATAKVTKKMDRQAFAREYQAIYRRLWLFAVGLMNDTSLADDIVQEAAIVAFNRRDEFREGSNFSAWLREIVKRLARNAQRKASRRRTFTADPEELDQQSQPPTRREPELGGELAALSSVIGDDMFRVLSQIPQEARCCMLLRVIDGLTYAEISQLTGIPEGTAMSHVHRAKSFAQKRLQSSNDVGGMR